MHEIYPDLLWLGHALDVREPQGLFDVGINAVVDVAYDEPPAQLPRQLTYCRFPLVDGGGNNLELLALSVRTTVALLQAGTKTIVACSAGMSRSPTVASFALAIYLGQDAQDVVAEIAKSKQLELNPEFWSDVSKSLSREDLAEE